MTLAPEVDDRQFVARLDAVDRARPPQRIAVVGAGYVGLTSGACLASRGLTVTCADIDASKIDVLESGGVPIHERGLGDVIAAARASGHLSFRLGTKDAVRHADVVMLCVPTPQGADGQADLTYLLDASRSIGPDLRPGAVVVNKSTVPVGSAAAVRAALGRDDVDVASNPEFLREGSAVDDFQHPDRVVIGADDPSTARWLATMYDGVDGEVFLTTTAAAETIKYVANGFLAMKVSFANATAALCEAVGADIFDVMRGIGSDRRIGHEFLQPGPGWGGSCFPKDSRALVSIGAAHGYDFEMIRVAISVNDQQLVRMVQKIHRAVGRDVDDPRRLEGVRVGVLGLTFKAGTDDLRESPSLAVIQRLRERGADVVAYDPTARGELTDVQRFHLGDLEIARETQEIAVAADVVLVMTEWPEFRHVIDAEFVDAMRGRAIVDTRNLLDKQELEVLGLDHVGVGR